MFIWLRTETLYPHSLTVYKHFPNLFETISHYVILSVSPVGKQLLNGFDILSRLISHPYLSIFFISILIVFGPGASLVSVPSGIMEKYCICLWAPLSSTSPCLFYIQESQMGVQVEAPCANSLHCHPCLTVLWVIVTNPTFHRSPPRS